MQRCRYIIAWFFLALVSCKASNGVSLSVDQDDDLIKYMYKPKVKQKEETPSTVEDEAVLKNIRFEKHINASLNALMDSMAVSNRRYQSAPGYRILVYAGNSNEESLKAKKAIYDWSQDYEVYTQYRQPAFRVKVGNFPDRIGAHYVLSDLIRFFPNAVIIPDQIELK